jgi:hypothetical protein
LGAEIGEKARRSVKREESKEQSLEEKKGSYNSLIRGRTEKQGFSRRNNWLEEFSLQDDNRD